MKISLFTSAFLLIGSSGAFSSPNIERRNFIEAAAGAAATLAFSTQAANAAPLGKLPDSVVQREINSFNDLVYNFKDTTLNGGLDASTLNEPSISFIEFGERMKNGEVAFVEFMAPSGDVAYVTFKPKAGDKKKGDKRTGGSDTPGEKIRIGQGYPTESKNSWSSPAYVIRSVSNFGVPYKFTVPALAKYRTAKK